MKIRTYIAAGALVGASLSYLEQLFVENYHRGYKAGRLAGAVATTLAAMEPDAGPPATPIPEDEHRCEAVRSISTTPGCGVQYRCELPNGHHGDHHAENERGKPLEWTGYHGPLRTELEDYARRLDNLAEMSERTVRDARQALDAGLTGPAADAVRHEIQAHAPLARARHTHARELREMLRDAR